MAFEKKVAIFDCESPVIKGTDVVFFTRVKDREN